VVTEATANSINALVRFCACRDVSALTRDALVATVGRAADVAILFGGSILAGADVFAEAMREGVASHYMVVGGQGHTTDALRRTLGRRMGWDDAASGTEAALFARYLWERHGLAVDLVEQGSTNCGNNVTNALALLRANGVPHERLVLVQDATMQRRMGAGFRRHAAPSTQIVNYACHQTTVACVDGVLGYAAAPEGMWPLDRYVSLLMGEVPRLTDDANGYGPAGRGYIAHVDVPPEVQRAFAYLRETTDFATRAADPRWAG
jgi:uncharacterized SAM-binding protein YcdF (DUF218 family)